MEFNLAGKGRVGILTADVMEQNHEVSGVVLFILDIFIWLLHYFASLQIVMSE